MSGTGKSAVIQELIARGYKGYDLDAPEWCEWVDVDATDVLTRAKGKIGLARGRIHRYCPNREMGSCSSVAAPRIWVNSFP